MRKTAFAAGGAALAIALAGCGGTTEGNAQPLFGSAQELVSAASQQTSQAKTVKLNMDMGMGSKTVTANGKMRFAGANTSMAMTMDAMGSKVQFRFIDKVMYLKLPEQLSGQAGMSKPWIKISADGDGPMAKMMGPMLDQMKRNTDPTKMLERIEKAGAVTKKERTQLDGQQVSHYWINIDFDKVMSQLPSSGLPQQAVEKNKEKLKGVTIPMQLWLNDKALPLKITMDLTEVTKQMPKATGNSNPAADMGGKVTVRYSDWGKPVNITAPPQGKVGKLEMPKMPN